MKSRLLFRRAGVAAAALTFAIGVTIVPAGTAAAHTTADNRISTSRMTADRTYQIFTVLPNGTEPRQLTSGGRNKCDPAMSADGSMVAFSHGQKISIVPTDGSKVETVIATVPDDEFARAPAWSPDGNTIAFMRSVGYAGGQSTSYSNRIYAVQKVDGVWGEATPYTPAGVQAVSPKFSPDGRSLAFSRSARSSADKERDLWVMDVANKGLTQVTSMAGKEGMPSWHPRTPGLLLFTTCSRAVYTVTVGSGLPPAKVGKLSACDVSWESGAATNNRIVTNSGRCPSTTRRQQSAPSWTPAPPTASPTGDRRGSGVGVQRADTAAAARFVRCPLVNGLMRTARSTTAAAVSSRLLFRGLQNG